MSKRYIPAMLLAGALLLSGCGGDNEPAGQTPATDGSAPASAPASSDNKGSDNKGSDGKGKWVPAGQDARAELEKISADAQNNAKAKTFVMRQESKGSAGGQAVTGTTEMKIDATDPNNQKAHAIIENNGEKQEIIMIGKDMWMRSGEGPWQHQENPNPNEDNGITFQFPADYDIKALGESDVDGTKMRGYEVTHQSKQQTIQMFFDVKEMLLRKQISTVEDGNLSQEVVATFTDYGKKFDIKAPQ